MKNLLVAVALVLLPASAQAACFGSSTFSNCYDNSGNSYTVQRYGNTTITNGHNSRTGSSWSQNSQTFGNSTFHNGTASNGRSWNMHQQRIGNMDIYSGTDSDGNSFSYTCGAFGCN